MGGVTAIVKSDLIVSIQMIENPFRLQYLGVHVFLGREAPRRLVGRGCKVIGSGSAVPNLHISKTILEKLLKLQRNGFLFTLEFVIDEFFQLKVFTFRFACTQWSMLRRGCTFALCS
ncbi:hypothetical protein NE237_019877 [Protea cynaroides]|uniref:Uncharacterized protein n=1 Tax=Protea cynaroides TaxID=273540 RepID=A0A9Q0H9I3_9MAGN|nr:hypothetical protein NE237_019877 [Protea cynaroides]